MSMTRKDYGTDAIVPNNNEVVKRVNHLNSPFSAEATGADITGRSKALTDEAVEALTNNMRVLAGNKEGIITAISRPIDVVTEVQITFLGDNEGPKQVFLLTKAELIDSGFLLLVQ